MWSALLELLHLLPLAGVLVIQGLVSKPTLNLDMYASGLEEKNCSSSLQMLCSNKWEQKRFSLCHLISLQYSAVICDSVVSWQLYSAKLSSVILRHYGKSNNLNTYPFRMFPLLRLWHKNPEIIAVSKSFRKLFFRNEQHDWR